MTPPEPGDLPAVLAGLAGVGFDVALDAAPGSDWTGLDRYAEDAPLLHAGLRLAGERFGLPDVSPMTAGWFVGDIAAAIAWPAVATLLTHNRLLVSDARDIHVPHPASARRLTARITQLDDYDRQLTAIADARVRPALHHPPAYLLRTVGHAPAPGTERDRWRDAVRQLERYRTRYAITDPSRR